MANDSANDPEAGGGATPGDRLAAARARLSGLASAASETERRSEIEERANRPDPLKKLGKGAMVALSLVIVGMSVTMIWGTVAAYRSVTELPPVPPGARNTSQSGAEARAALEAALRDAGLSATEVVRMIGGDRATTDTTSSADAGTTETETPETTP